eukprot:m51a1_g13621 putative serine threonine-protein kinase ctr1-like (259) ;mRNA; f:588-2067
MSRDLARALKAALFCVRGDGPSFKWEAERDREHGRDLEVTINYLDATCTLVLSDHGAERALAFPFGDVGTVRCLAGGVLDFSLLRPASGTLLTGGAVERVTSVRVSYHTREKGRQHASRLSEVLGSDVVTVEDGGADDELGLASLTLSASRTIPFSELDFGPTRRIIGRGFFGTVVRAKFCGQDVAVKFLRDGGNPNLDLRRFFRELNMLCCARHPSVVLCYGACVEPPNFCIVTQYVPYDSSGNALNLRGHSGGALG